MLTGHYSVCRIRSLYYISHGIILYGILQHYDCAQRFKRERQSNLSSIGSLACSRPMGRAYKLGSQEQL